jgi:DNA polymerase-3 subunit delta'
MPDISPLLSEWTKSPEWLDLSGAISNGGAPQSLAAVVPAEAADDFRFRFARLALCFSGTGDDCCGSCACWTSDGHPDMITAGKPGEPPGIADCLDFQWRMSLKPVSAPGRLGVIMSADSLSLPAANSLLKIAEEPPAKGRILFMAERDELIPTIRSRVWMVRIGRRPGEPTLEPKAPPGAGVEWAEWLSDTKKRSLDDIASEAGAWVLYLCARGEWRLAASIENAVFLAKKRHFSVSMAQDALFALLMEGASDGKLFGDLREA